jgi:hypothetical protein
VNLIFICMIRITPQLVSWSILLYIVLTGRHDILFSLGTLYEHGMSSLHDDPPYNAQLTC